MRVHVSSREQLTARPAERALPRRATLIAALCAAVLLAFVSVAPSADAYIYWADGGQGLTTQTIARAAPDGSHVIRAWLKNITPGGVLLGVARGGGYIFWTWWNNGLNNNVQVWIGRANVDGSGVNPKLITLPPGAGDNRVVPVADSQHIYFRDTFATPNSLVGRANLDGSDVNLDFLDNDQQNPFAVQSLALQPPFIYFYTGNAIGRANLADGSGANPSFITGTGGKLTSAMAADANYLYWDFHGDCNEGYSPGGVARVGLDGTGMNKSLITGVCSNYALAVDGSHIYWTDNAKTIARANIDGSNVNESFITGVFPSPTTSIAVDSLGPASPGGSGACIVPSLKGKKLAAARKALTRNQCSLGKVTRKKSGRAQRNHVLAQTPAAGRRLPAGGRVSLTLGK